MKYLKDKLADIKNTADFRENQEIRNESRRRFFELTGKFGFTAAAVAAGGAVAVVAGRCARVPAAVASRVPSTRERVRRSVALW